MREFLRGPKEKQLAHPSEFENLHISFRDTLSLANKGVTIFFLSKVILFSTKSTKTVTAALRKEIAQSWREK